MKVSVCASHDLWSFRIIHQRKRQKICYKFCFFCFSDVAKSVVKNSIVVYYRLISGKCGGKPLNSKLNQNSAGLRICNSSDYFKCEESLTEWRCLTSLLIYISVLDWSFTTKEKKKNPADGKKYIIGKSWGHQLRELVFALWNWSKGMSIRGWGSPT